MMALGPKKLSTKRLAALAAKGFKAPEKMTLKEIQSLCGSVLAQRREHGRPALWEEDPKYRSVATEYFNRRAKAAVSK